APNYAGSSQSSIEELGLEVVNFSSTAALAVVNFYVIKHSVMPKAATESRGLGRRANVRSVARSVSLDFIHWSVPEPLDFGGAPTEHLYTNAATPYFRAPHIFLAFPMRFVREHRDACDPVRSLQ